MKTKGESRDIVEAILARIITHMDDIVSYELDDWETNDAGDVICLCDCKYIDGGEDYKFFVISLERLRDYKLESIIN